MSSAPPAPTEREVASAVRAVTEALGQYSLATCVVALRRALEQAQVNLTLAPPAAPRPPSPQRVHGKYDDAQPYPGPRRRKDD